MKKINMLHFMLVFVYLFFQTNSTNAKITKILFIGNSYTSENNLPKLIHDVALSTGDTIQFDSYTPGGYQLSDHVLDLTCQQKIKSGTWDYIVIQGQSQEPIMRTSQYYNAGLSLYHLIKQYNSCAEVITYMTWGRKNGDKDNCASFPQMCTYLSMDTALRKAYIELTSSLSSATSPVSVVWNYIRKQHPGIELYQSDESHPSMAGSYAAACCFYSTFLKKNPLSITFNPGLNPSDAANIRSVVKSQVYDSLTFWDYKRPPVSDFRFEIGPGINEVKFMPISQGIKQNYHWDFGDGFTSTMLNPTHSYANDGSYKIVLTTSICNLQGMHTSASDTVIQFCSHTPTVYALNPWLCNRDTIWTQPADRYSWFINGVHIPESKRFLADYSRYGIGSFSVLSTLGGCSELSIPFSQLPELSGYYFDAIGDPCKGDTVAFTVLHINGSLSGSEKIKWYKNGVLLPLMNDKDTLRISTAGKYVCKVINPNSICPFDTTDMTVEYNCGTVYIDVLNGEQFPRWSIFPNPVKDILMVRFENEPIHETLYLYDVMGRLLLSKDISSSNTELAVDSLPSGIYTLQLRTRNMSPIRFLKL